MNCLSLMMKELFLDELLSIIGEENTLEQLSSGVLVIYGGFFASGGGRALLL